MSQTRRDRYKELNTLACIVTGLQGWRTTIELQNDAYVSGKIIYGDGMMNIEMIDVKYTDGNGKSQWLDNFYIKGRKIRFIHIPQEIDVVKLIQQEVIIEPKSRQPTLKQMKMRKKDIQTLKRYHGHLMRAASPESKS